MSELRVSSIKNLSGQPLITKTTLGLDQVDNTSDLAKPISTAVQMAIDNLPVLPTGGKIRQVLTKGGNTDFDVVWSDAPRVLHLFGSTPSSVPLILSVDGGSSNPTVASQTIDIGNSTSALLKVKALARAVNGLTRVFHLDATVKNGAVLDLNLGYTYGESGSGGWSLDVQWQATLGSYVLVATGYATQAVNWSATVEMIIL